MFRFLFATKPFNHRRTTLYSFKKFAGTVIFTCLIMNFLQGIEAAENTPVPEYNLYPNVKKISDDFYIGKIKDKDLWLVMEQVNSSERKELWLKYINLQVAGALWGIKFIGNDGRSIMPNFNSDGSYHFKQVLEGVNLNKNEVWVAYITTNPLPVSIDNPKNSKIEYYDSENLPGSFGYNPQVFPNNIVMYVTVTTSPNALLTSHMGVSLSIEGIYQRKDRVDLKGISMDLHSFAAKVMYMKNPERKFMINAPAFEMERIIVQGLPDGSFFAGTREMKKRLDDHKNMTIDQYKTLHLDEIRRKAIKSAGSYIPSHNRYLTVLKGMRDSRNYTEEEYQSQLEKEIIAIHKHSLEIDKNHIISIPERTIEEKIDEISKRDFDYTQRQGFKGWKGAETLAELFEKYPPLLSVDGSNTKSISQQFTVFDKDHPERPWLTVHKGDLHYDWMFSEPFQPAGVTHFIAVDLKNMADSKQLDPGE